MKYARKENDNDVEYEIGFMVFGTFGGEKKDVQFVFCILATGVHSRCSLVWRISVGNSTLNYVCVRSRESEYENRSNFFIVYIHQ